MNTLDKSALIVVDMQNDYCSPKGALGIQGLDTSGAARIVDHIQKLIDVYHMKGLPVIFIQTFHEDATDSLTWISRGTSANTTHNGVCRRNSWGSEFYGVAPTDQDIVVIKHRYSAFFNTRLDSVLRRFNTEKVVVTGVATNVCVEGTIRDAFMNDYQVVAVSNGTAAFSQEQHEAALYTISRYFGQVLTADELLQELQVSVIQV